MGKLDQCLIAARVGRLGDLETISVEDVSGTVTEKATVLGTRVSPVRLRDDKCDTPRPGNSQHTIPHLDAMLSELIELLRGTLQLVRFDEVKVDASLFREINLVRIDKLYVGQLPGPDRPPGDTTAVITLSDRTGNTIALPTSARHASSGSTEPPRISPEFTPYRVGVHYVFEPRAGVEMAPSTYVLTQDVRVVCVRSPSDVTIASFDPNRRVFDLRISQGRPTAIRLWDKPGEWRELRQARV